MLRRRLRLRSARVADRAGAASARRRRGCWSSIAPRRRGAKRRSRDLPRLLAPGDLLVVNDTRVFPARLLGRRDPSGGAVECLLLERVDDTHWHALVHPGQKLKPGARMVFEDPARAPGVVLRAEMLERRVLRPAARRASSVDGAAESRRGGRRDRPHAAAAVHPSRRTRRRIASAIRRSTRARADRSRRRRPDCTSTHALLDALDARGHRARADHAARRLRHVQAGARRARRGSPRRRRALRRFRRRPPTRSRRARGGPARRRGRHDDDARARERGGRDGPGARRAPARPSCSFIPATSFRVVDALLTNFHLPRSSLLMLVAAFAGRELMLAAYRDAVARGFRFYSYGDAMLIRDDSGRGHVEMPSVKFPLRRVRSLRRARRIRWRRGTSKAHHEDFAKPWDPSTGLRRLARVAAEHARRRGFPRGRRGDPQRARRRPRDRLGPRRARDQDRPGAGARSI